MNKATTINWKEHFVTYQSIYLFILLTTIVIAIWSIFWIIIDSTIFDKNGIESYVIKGVFGDKFGAVNSLFSALALAGIIYSIILQSKELKLQRDEVNETQRVFRTQQFEAIFFNLIRTQQEITTQTEFLITQTVNKEFPGSRENVARTVKGRELFTILMVALKKEYDSRTGDPRAKSKEAYFAFFEKNHNQLGHYFRHLYNILKFLSESEKNEINSLDEKDPDKNSKEKEIEKLYSMYAGFIQAQMSSSELFLLFYNGLCFDEMYKLLIKYNQLENLAQEDLLEPSHASFYKGMILKKRRDIIS